MFPDAPQAARQRQGRAALAARGQRLQTSRELPEARRRGVRVRAVRDGRFQQGERRAGVDF